MTSKILNKNGGFFVITTMIANYFPFLSRNLPSLLCCQTRTRMIEMVTDGLANIEVCLSSCFCC